MKKVLLAMTILAALFMTSCKKNWECSRSYLGNPNDPNSTTITQYMDITAKGKKEAKLECQAFADEAGKGTEWDLKAK